MFIIIAEINKSDISRIQIYVNSSKKTMTQIKTLTGCDYIINAGLFNGDWTPCCQLKADGVRYLKNTDNYWSLCWNNPNDVCMALAPMNDSKYSNYLACIALKQNGVKETLAINNANKDKAVGYSTKRSAVGLKNGKFVMYCSTTSMIPSQLYNYLDGQGWSDILMLDGGGSVQGNFLGQSIYSSRIVHNYILVYLKKNESEPPATPDNGLKVLQSYMYNNPCYTKQIKCNKTKMMLHSTGTPGAMFEAFFNSMNKASAGISVEGMIDCYGIHKTLPYGIKSWHCASSANNTHIACEICEPQDTRLLDPCWLTLSLNGKYNTKWAVALLQQELIAWGYDPNGVDGNFGNGCDKAVRAFQKAKGLNVDGYVGLGTLHALQKRSGSLLKYNAEKNKAYFDNVYNKAVWYFATTLKEIGGKASEIICHSEGYKQGIASNHADVMHWFPEHGKSMDTFRADVAKMMGEGGAVTPPPVNPPIADNSPITKVQKLLNSKFNAGLTVDGSWGPASKLAFTKAVQQTINRLYNKNLVYDGSFGPASVSACPDLKYHTVNDLVFLCQMGLVVKGYNLDIDGSYGPSCEAAVKKFQQSKGLKADGICGGNTFAQLCK